MSDHLPELPAGAYRKEDTDDDAPPRLVSHIDDTATAALSASYRAALPTRAVILDLMWTREIGQVAKVGSTERKHAPAQRVEPPGRRGTCP